MLLDLLSDLYGPSGPGPIPPPVVLLQSGGADALGRRPRRLVRNPALAIALDDEEFAVLLQLTGQKR